MLKATIFTRHMNSKIAVLMALISAFSLVAGEEQPKRVKYSSVEYFKNYALSFCIANGYPSSQEVVDDAAAAARGYFEFGSLPIEAHTEADLLAIKFLKKEYKSKDGEPLTMMKCIDFYHSKELDKIARKYHRKK